MKIESYQTSFLTTMIQDQKSTIRKKSVKNTNTWRLKKMLLNNQWITEEIKEEIKICLQTQENENMTQNLRDAAKIISKGSLQQYNLSSGNNKISNMKSNLTLNNAICHNVDELEDYHTK